MPTPFTHIIAAQRLLDEPDFPDTHRQSLLQYPGAFFLGNIAPDAHHMTQPRLTREATHFFEYQPEVDPPAIHNFFNSHPELAILEKNAHDAFITGYIAHLAVDQYWCEHILFPDFYGGQWKTPQERFTALHYIITYMDMRDYEHLTPAQYHAIKAVEPDYWLPFLPDYALKKWQHEVSEQFNPEGGESRTIEILGKRTPEGPDVLKQVLESPEAMQERLWDYVSPEKLAATESGMYHYMFESIVAHMGR